MLQQGLKENESTITLNLKSSQLPNSMHRNNNISYGGGTDLR